MAKELSMVERNEKRKMAGAFSQLLVATDAAPFHPAGTRISIIARPSRLHEKWDPQHNQPRKAFFSDGGAIGPERR